MPGNAIYKYSEEKLEKWLENLESPNAMFVEDEHLFIGVNAKVLRVNTNDKSIETFVQFEASALIDGIQPDGEGDYLVSDYNGKIYSVTSRGKRTLLLNTATPGIQSADFCYIPDKQLLIIPTFYNNSITAYEYSK